MIALLNWLLILVLCMAIVRHTSPVGFVPAAIVMVAVTAVVARYVEQELGVSWILLATVAGLSLLLAGHYRDSVTQR